MSCHISALCTTLSCLRSGLVKTSMGRGLREGWHTHLAPSKHRQHLKFTTGGATLWREHLPCHYKTLLISSLHTHGREATLVRRTLWSDGLFSGCGGVLGESDARSEERSATLYFRWSRDPVPAPLRTASISNSLLPS